MSKTRFSVSLPEVQIQINNCPMERTQWDIPKPHQIHIPKAKLLPSHQIVRPPDNRPGDWDHHPFAYSCSNLEASSSSPLPFPHIIYNQAHQLRVSGKSVLSLALPPVPSPKLSTSPTRINLPGLPETTLASSDSSSTLKLSKPRLLLQ